MATAKKNLTLLEIYDNINKALAERGILIRINNNFEQEYKEIDSCSPAEEDFENPDTLKFVMYHTVNNDLIGFFFLNKYPNCVYINYWCIKPKYRGKKLGTFLGFIAIYYAMNFNIRFRAVYSTGVCGDEHKIDNNSRVGEGKICSSQLILIKKFGFYDNFKKIKKKEGLNRMNQNKYMSNYELCEGDAETILYIRDKEYNEIEENLVKYKEYESALFTGTAPSILPNVRLPSPKKTSPRRTSPKKTSPKRTLPKRTSPKRTSPKRTSPKKTSPKRTSPKRTSPKRTSPKRTSTRTPVTKKSNVKPKKIVSGEK